MSSPYQLDIAANRVSTIRSYRGFSSLLTTIAKSAGVAGPWTLDALRAEIAYCASDEFSYSTPRPMHIDAPLLRLLSDLIDVFDLACKSRATHVAHISPRYGWTGYKAFGRTIVFDMSASADQKRRRADAKDSTEPVVIQSIEKKAEALLSMIASDRDLKSLVTSTVRSTYWELFTNDDAVWTRFTTVLAEDARSL